jgi:CRISPR-associated endonuclease/helicase Cas3
MDFLAKSSGETLVEHTNNLLEQLRLLRRFYPNALSNEQEWSLLLLACKYHDLGKINDKFQNKIKHSKKIMETGELPHGVLSVSLMSFAELKKHYSVSEIKALANAVALHHERDFSKFNNDDYKREVLLLKNLALLFDFSELNLPQITPRVPSGRFFAFGTVLSSEKDPLTYDMYVRIKGFLNRIDFAASGHYSVEIPDNGYLQTNLKNNSLGKWKKHDSKASWNEMQVWMQNHTDDNVVIAAQTGMGKTEGGLLWLGNSKGFFTLPLKAAINSIYYRIKHAIFENSEDSKNHVGILHSDMQQVLLDELDDEDNIDEFKSYLNETRGWSLPLTIATLDQIFNIVYHYRGYEHKLATLSYSKLIIDEIQMYSPDLLAYLVYGLTMIQKVGGKFAVMTATLAPFVVDLFKKHDLNFVMPDHEFLLSEFSQRHFVKVLHEELTSDDIISNFHNNKMLVICNTVNKAVSLYDELSRKLASTVNVNLIHSRFIRKDRKNLEEKITRFAQNNNSDCGIWIGTQVVEASLDLDFDVLYTELSELNSLFQRMGRCYRRRNFDQTGYNVFVFDGGLKLSSGVRNSDRSVYDYDMFLLSKLALRNVDGLLDEQEKMQLISKTYTTENLKKSLYLKAVDNTFRYLQSCSNDHKSKSEISKEFRNIETLSVIPEEVFKQNLGLFERLRQVRSLVSNDDTYRSFMMLKNKILDLTVQIPTYLFYKQDSDIIVDKVEISRYQKIPVLSATYCYDSQEGLSLKSTKTETDDNIW